MKLFLGLFWGAFFFLHSLAAQPNFPYTLSLHPLSVEGLPGLHSYAFGQHEGKWLIVGGRKDGIHARQPFNAFPASQNNSTLYVIDIESQAVWSASLEGLPAMIAEQLQATNANFCQSGDTLYVAGGYAYSASAESHITFPALTAIALPGLVAAIQEGSDISPYFRQLMHDNFAITGGQLAKLNDTFYLVGGHRFDGRYNPMNGPSFSQEYSNQIRKFTLLNTPAEFQFNNYQTITDPIHLHRRDYNLLPQLFADGSRGFTISSGVFQYQADLPYLYPVEIRSDGLEAITDFNQYLSNYHSAKASLFSAINNEAHHLFFGGISRYYYENDVLVEDDDVPFVHTISLLSRLADGSYQETKLDLEMPALQGASAEFIPADNLASLEGEIILLDQIADTSFTIGHIYGGIHSNSRHPFTFNETSSETAADATIYEVRLHRQAVNAATNLLPTTTGSAFLVYPNPANNILQIKSTTSESFQQLDYFISNTQGQIVAQGKLDTQQEELLISLDSLAAAQTYLLTLVVDHRYYSCHSVQKH